MNNDYLGWARQLASLNFCLDSDSLNDDVDHAVNIAREIYYHETPTDLWAAFSIDEQGPIHVHLEMREGAIVRTSVTANFEN